MKALIVALLALTSLSTFAENLKTEEEMLNFSKKVMNYIQDEEFDKASKEVSKQYIDSKDTASIESLFNQIKAADKIQVERLGKKVEMILAKECKNRDFFYNVKFIQKFEKSFQPISISFYSPKGKGFKISSFDYGEKAHTSDLYCSPRY